ncbi:hypothetical protein [Litchfieldia alkalitelluris]|nr:hypothetical protein [Litchfieldia alkalitelluris]
MLSDNGSPSPFNLPGAWSINTDKASAMGYVFTPLETLLTELISSYC